jgi:MFS family permease
LLGISLIAAPCGGLLIWLGGQWLGGFRIGLPGSLLMGLGFGLLLPLIFGFVPREVTARTSPNEGTRQSGWNGVLFGLLIGPLLGVFSAATRSLALGLGHWRIAFAGASLAGGLIFFLYRGGSFFLSHWFVRLILRFYGYAPLRYVGFLDYATSRLFLKRAGGGYLFAHRVLMEYFLSEEAVSHQPGLRLTGSNNL